MIKDVAQVSPADTTKLKKYCMLAARGLNHELVTWLMAIYRNTAIVQGCHRDYWYKTWLQYSVVIVAW